MYKTSCQQEFLRKPDFLRLKEAEMCRDIEGARRILSTFWTDTDINPDVSEFEPLIQAELLRFCGFFLSWHGRARGRIAYQSRGKNLLTRSVEMFEQLGYPDKVAEARVLLAHCYWYEGEVEECEAILDYTLEQFKANQLHPVYLQIHINRMLVLHFKQDYQAAIKLVEKLKVLVELCPDLRLKTMYHNHAGMFYARLKQYDLALFNQNEAIRFARKLKSRRYVAINLNNLAYLNMEVADFSAAHRHIEESIGLFEELSDEGWIAHALDTKALIFEKESKIPEAFQTINDAIQKFERGEDYSGLADAMWTKTHIWLRSGRKAEALQLFAELITLSKQRIGQSAVEKYSKKLADSIFFFKNSSFPAEVKRLKSERISRALRDNDSSIVDAAQDLQISHQTLSEILRNQFPDLREKFKLNDRAPRRVKSVFKKQERNKTVNALPTNKIRQVDLSIFEARFDESEFDDDDEIFAFFVPGENLAQFEIDGSAVIAVLRANFCPDAPVLIFLRETGRFKTGIGGYDNLLGFYYLLDGEGEPVPLVSDEFITVGKIIGFCLERDIHAGEIIFEKLSI